MTSQFFACAIKEAYPDMGVLPVLPIGLDGSRHLLGPPGAGSHFRLPQEVLERGVEHRGSTMWSGALGHLAGEDRILDSDGRGRC